MTQLIIEDGSVVADANSYVTDAEYVSYASLRGKTMPSTAAEREAQLVMAYDYLTFTYESRLQGERTKADQTGFMPRRYMYAFNESVLDNVIPSQFKKAQMMAALSINDGVDTNATKTDPDLASFTVVGVYAETYQSGKSTPVLASMPAVSRVLQPYTKNGSTGGGTYRQNMGFLG